MEKTIKIEGMMCGHCEMHVKKALEALPGVSEALVSNEKGELAVYEPSGIASTVMAMSGSGTETFVGTLYANKLISGERDIAARQLYPGVVLRGLGRRAVG